MGLSLSLSLYIYIYKYIYQLYLFVSLSLSLSLTSMRIGIEGCPDRSSTSRLEHSPIDNGMVPPTRVRLYVGMRHVCVNHGGMCVLVMKAAWFRVTGVRLFSANVRVCVCACVRVCVCMCV